MKKTIAFTIADNNNKPYAEMLKKTFWHFHKEIPFVIYSEQDFDKTGFSKPEPLFYLATPLFAKKLFEEGYEKVIKIDADSLVLGNLDHILTDELFDTGVVMNWNRVDPKIYGEIGLATIAPQEYFNNGFVVMQNKDFVNRWWELCNSHHFNRMPFREQGFLNILCHYGNYIIRCFDNSNKWHGLISKGEWLKFIVKDNKIILPKSIDGYPEEDKIIKIIHQGGGNMPVKMNYKTWFQEPVIEYINNLLK